MCRLFGLTSGTARVRATFWLLDAPDSLEAQSHRNVDGSGIGFFDPAGEPVVDKQPEPAFADQEFIHEAKDASSSTFVAHVRWATAGGRTIQNTHPFTMGGRIMAHNGGFGELPRLDEQLGSYAGLVLGDTDSERYFALITQQIDAHGGDVGAGIAAAAGWIAANLPVSSLNTVVVAPGELWALRYPDQHALHILQRPPGRDKAAAGKAGPHGLERPTGGGQAGAGNPGPHGLEGPTGGGQAAAGNAGPHGLERPTGGGQAAAGDAGLHVRSATSSVHVPGLGEAASVVVASERLDGEDGWRMLAPGELVHVRADLSVDCGVVLSRPPARLVPLPAGNPNIDT
jgi:predicted glutamine amidotransferase